MTTYYVSKEAGASDGNAGTSQLLPWLTISKVNGSSFAAGDAILFRCGDLWREQLTAPSSGSSGQPIVFGSYGTGAQPIISGANVVTGWAPAGVGTNTYSVSLATQCRGVIVNGSWSVLGSGFASLNNGQWFWAANVLYYRSDAGNPDSISLTIEATQRSRCLNAVAKHFLTVQDITFTAGDTFGVVFDTSNNALVQRCTFTLMATNGSNFGCVYFGDNTGCTATGNTFTNVYNKGIVLLRAVGASLVYNTITPINGTASDGIFCFGATSCTISNNYINMVGSDSGKGCIIITTSANPSTGNLVSRNICVDGNYGIAMSSPSSICSDNLCVNTGVTPAQPWNAGLYIADVANMDGIAMYRNIVTGAVNGLHINGAFDRSNFTFQHNTLMACSSNGVFIDGSSKVSGFFRNNIVASASGFTGFVFNAQAGTGVVAAQSWTSDYNCFYPETASHFVLYLGGTNYDTLAAYQSGASQDAHSIKNDPLLVSGGSVPGDLQSTSPCINAGVVIAGINDGASGAPQYIGTAPDMGAIEYSPRSRARPWKKDQPMTGGLHNYRPWQ